MIGKQPGLLEALDELVNPETRGDPMSLLRWTSKSSTRPAFDDRQQVFTPLVSTTANGYTNWTERSPAAVVMVYVPRDDQDRDVVMGVIRASYEFASTQMSNA